MAIRLTTDQIIKTAIAVLLVAWAALLLTGCKTDVPVVVDAPIVVEAPVDVTGVDLSKNATTTTTVPVSVGDVGGDVTVITLANATPWTIAGLVGLLGLFQARRQSTAVGTIDRVVFEIDKEMGASSCPEADQVFKDLKDRIERNGHTKDGKPDSIQRCLHARLLKLGLAHTLPRKIGRDKES